MKAVVAAVIAALAVPAVAFASTIDDARREVIRLFGEDASQALCIVRAESRWRPRVVSRTNDHGLFQLNAPTWAPYFGARWQLVYDPVQNVRMAHIIYQRAGGFTPWSTSRSCT